jgi:hypothetical protein
VVIVKVSEPPRNDRFRPKPVVAKRSIKP